MKTKVQFLYHEPETENSFPDIFAYFPEENYDHNGTLKTSYSHIGQHSACNPDYAKECRQATRKEYTDLETELIILGYDLEVINQRLEYLRTELRNECISYGKLSELYGLAEYIDPNDMELLEAAGVPEH